MLVEEEDKKEELEFLSERGKESRVMLTTTFVRVAMRGIIVVRYGKYDLIRYDIAWYFWYFGIL